MERMESIRDVCRLLGGLTLEGAKPEVLSSVRDTGLAEQLADQVDGPLAAALRELRVAAFATSVEELGVEYTRLVLTGTSRRKPAPVPPWEDCWQGTGRAVMGERSRAALLSYAAANLGFDGLKDRPADHIGLELLFVATLLDEELSAGRDASSRAAFVRDHLTSFCPAIGAAFVSASPSPFWSAVGAALSALPPWLASRAELELVPPARTPERSPLQQVANGG